MTGLLISVAVLVVRVTVKLICFLEASSNVAVSPLARAAATLTTHRARARRVLRDGAGHSALPDGLRDGLVAVEAHDDEEYSRRKQQAYDSVI